MRKKKIQEDSLIKETDLIEQYASYLRSHGYIVFKVDDEASYKEIDKAKAIGCKIEFYKDALVKADPAEITSSDDVVLYFYERLKRSNCINYNPQKLKDKKSREVDRSVIRHFIEWRVASGVSFREAIEELFIMIDTLFEIAPQEKIEIHSASILSIVKNKPFVLDLLRKAHIKQDLHLKFEVERLIENDELLTYTSFLEEAKKRMSEVNQVRPKVERKKIKV